MASRFAQRVSFEEPLPVGSFGSFGSFRPFRPSTFRVGTDQPSRIGAGQRRQDFSPPPRPFSLPTPEPSAPFSLDREPPSIRPQLPKGLGSLLGTTSSDPEGIASGMSLSDVLSVSSLPAQRKLLFSDPDMFGLSNLFDRGGMPGLNEFLMGASRNDPGVFLRELLGKMRLRPSSLLGGL